MAKNLLKFGALPAKQTAFFLCDMQEKFRPLISHFEIIVKSAARLSKLSEVLRVPLIVTEQYPSGLGHTVPEIQKDHAVGVFPKTRFSMCIPEVIKEMEKIDDLQSVVLFGIETHACIEQTAMDLRGRGLQVHVVADSCSSRSVEDRMLAFQRMKQIGCFITTTENVIFKLLEDKNNPKFNDVRPLFMDVTPYSGLCGLVSTPAKL